MVRSVRSLRPLACGAITCGFIQIFSQVDFNQIWFQFLLTLFNTIVALLTGNDPTGGLNGFSV